MEAKPPPPAGRRPRHVDELADIINPAREIDDVRGGRPRPQARAFYQPSVPGLVTTLGPISASAIVHALVA